MLTPRVKAISIGNDAHLPAGVRVLEIWIGDLHNSYMIVLIILFCERDDAGPSTEVLQFVDMFTLSNDDSRARLPEDFQLYFYNSTLCVFSRYNERGVCHVDSGGPVVDPDGILVGAESWG